MDPTRTPSFHSGFAVPSQPRTEAKSRATEIRPLRSRSLPVTTPVATPARARSHSVESPPQDIPGLRLRLREANSLASGAAPPRSAAPALTPLRPSMPKLEELVVTDLVRNIPDGMSADRLLGQNARTGLTAFFLENCTDFFVDVRNDLTDTAPSRAGAQDVALQRSFERRWMNVSQGVLETMSSIASHSLRELRGRESEKSVMEMTRAALFDVFVQALTEIQTKAPKSLADHQQRMDKRALLEALQGLGHDQQLVPSPKEPHERVFTNPLYQRLDFSEAATTDRKSAGTAAEAGFNEKQVHSIKLLLARAIETRADPRRTGDDGQAADIAENITKNIRVPGTFVSEGNPDTVVGVLKKLLGATPVRDGLLAHAVAASVGGPRAEDPVDLSRVDPGSLAGSTLRWLALCLRDGTGAGVRYTDPEPLAIAAGQLFFTRDDVASPVAAAASSAQSTPRSSGFLSFFGLRKQAPAAQATSTQSSLEATRQIATQLAQARRAHVKLISVVCAALDDKSSPWYEAPLQQADKLRSE